ncbi:MAG: hypothetical protein ACYTFG_22715 [Planctomycetota bacterium]|jgi:hypothetical protein
MKKFLVVLLLLVAVGGGVGAFFFMGQVFLQSQVKTRIQELFDRADGYRAGFNVTEGEVLTYFDMENYDPDPEVRRPFDWVAKWQYENQAPNLRRILRETKFITCTKTDAEVEFTIDEGDPGEKSKNRPPDMTPYRYHAILTMDPEKQVWLFRSLKSLSE